MNRNVQCVIYIMIPLIISFHTSSCTTSYSIEEKLLTIMNKKIIINDSTMISLNKTYDVSKYEPTDYKYVIFMDSSECTSCNMRNLYEWNKYFELEKKNKVTFYFIFDTHNVSDIKKTYRNSNLHHGVLVDTCRSFISNNDSILLSSPFHCYLLNKNNEIIMVGNILKNKKIEQLFYYIINNQIHSIEVNLQD